MGVERLRGNLLRDHESRTKRGPVSLATVVMVEVTGRWSWSRSTGVARRRTLNQFPEMEFKMPHSLLALFPITVYLFSWGSNTEIPSFSNVVPPRV